MGGGYSMNFILDKNSHPIICFAHIEITALLLYNMLSCLFVFSAHQVQLVLLIYSCICGLPLKCAWLTGCALKLLIGSSFSGQGSAICPSLLSMLGFGMAWSYTGFVYVTIVSSYVKWTCCVWKTPFPCTHSLPLVLAFSPPLFHNDPQALGEGGLI